MSSPQHVQIYIAFASAAEARDVAARLVEQRLIACAQISTTQSVYSWNDEMQYKTEVLLRGKTLFHHLAAVEEVVNAYHSYEVPELIAVPVVWGSAAYLDWVEEETR